MLYSSLLWIVLFSLSHITQKQECFAPQGCTFTFTDGIAKCDFQNWTPPLQEGDFGPNLIKHLILNSINGTIPAEAFSGLHNVTSIRLLCGNHKTRLSRSIFTSNLHRVMLLRVEDCFLENGFPSRLFENLKSLKYLYILYGGIEGVIANDTLAGLINLLSLNIWTPVENGRLPSGFFDGLINLNTIDLRYTTLIFIPANMFNGLASLTQIVLLENELQTLLPGLFDGLRSLTHVGLSDNPWHCSCGLRWLLDWSNITEGGTCESPFVMQSLALEYALNLLKCTPSTLTVLSTASLSETKITDTRISPLSTNYAGSFVSSNAISSRQDLTSLTFRRQTFAIFKGYSAFPFIPTATFTPKTTPMTSTMNLLTTSAASLSTSPADVIGITKSSLHLSSILFGVQTVCYSTPRRSDSLKSSNTNTVIVDDCRNIIIISCVGALTLLLLLAIVMYRCGWQNQCIRNVMPMANEERNRHDPGSQNRNITVPF